MGLNAPAIYAAAIVVTILSLAAVLRRFGIRWAREVGFGADDWTSLVGLVSFDAIVRSWVVAEKCSAGRNKYNGCVDGR